MARVKAKILNFRVTEDDFERIHQKAYRARLSISGYLLAAALDKKIVVIEGLQEAVRELRKIGININQLTRLCNEGRITILEFSGIKGQLEDVWRLLNLLTQRAV